MGFGAGLDDRQGRVLLGGAAAFDFQVGSVYPTVGLGIILEGKVAVAINNMLMIQGGAGLGYRHFSAPTREPDPKTSFIGTPNQDAFICNYEAKAQLFPLSYRTGLLVGVGYKGTTNIKPDPWNFHAFTLDFGYIKTLENGDVISINLFLDIGNAEVGSFKEGVEIPLRKKILLAQGGTIAEMAMFAGLRGVFYWSDVPSLKKDKDKKK